MIKKFLNSKGSAMVLVLSALLILTAVGTSVIMLSAAGITMSRKYSSWSAEFYKLDYAAQEQLVVFDKNTLIPAETAARYYLQNSYYQYGSVGEFPAVSGTGAALSATVSNQMQILLFNKWMEINAILEDDSDSSASPQDEYDTAMGEFAEEAFRTLYYAYIEGYMASSSDLASNNIAVTLDPTVNSWFPDVNDYSTFDDFYAALTAMPEIEITASEPDAAVGKMVDVSVTIVPPSYLSVEQLKYVAVKVNPLYTNALSVQGDITFAGSGGTDSAPDIAIVGDVVSNNKNHSTGLTEGNDVGIKTKAGDAVDVAIYGNVQSAGDVHLLGDGSSITVKPYSAVPEALTTNFSTSLKNMVYGNDYFFDFAAVGTGADRYTEEYTAVNDTAYLPYIYRDSIGGNVYCNNLAIESGIKDGTLTVAGNVWTQDDIQNDGHADTHIAIGKNYIGMRSDANEANKDPNGSSAVINNAYLYGGTIAIDGSYIIPGTAWYKFSGVGSANSGTTYYQTAESASAQAGEYFQIYMAEPDELSSTYFVDAEEYYDLYEHEDSSTNYLGDRIDRFVSAMQDLSDLGSGIDISKTADKYSLGVVVDSDGTLVYDKDSMDAEKSAVYTANQVAYSAVSGMNGILSKVFTAKTQTYGTDGLSFANLTNGSYATNDPTHGFYHYNGNTMLNVGSISSGIVYVNGNLTITGNGTFRGSIICSGDVTIESGVKIVYDEAVIKQVLGVTSGSTIIKNTNGSYLARRFFAPAGYHMGSNLGAEEISTISANAGERESQEVKRYIINSWKESIVD